VGEVDGPLRPQPAGVDHAPRVRVHADQFPGHLQGGSARSHLRAPLVQQGQQPVPLCVGLFGQLADVDRQGLRCAHQRAERRSAERRIRVAFRCGPLQVGDQACVRGQRGLSYRLVCAAAEAPGAPRAAVRRCFRPGADPDRQPAGRAEQGLRDRRADLVKGLDGRVDHPWPGGQVLDPGRRALRRRRVIPFVAGQLELDQVQDRVAAVHLELGEGEQPQIFGRSQMRLVMRVSEPFAVVAGRHQPRQPGPDAGRGQVLRLAVVLVPSAVLAHNRDVQVTDRAQPRGKVHAADAT